jgi:hypothetical protein
VSAIFLCFKDSAEQYVLQFALLQIRALWGWECSSAVESALSIHKVLGSNASTKKIEKENNPRLQKKKVVLCVFVCVCVQYWGLNSGPTS